MVEDYSDNSSDIFSFCENYSSSDSEEETSENNKDSSTSENVSCLLMGGVIL